MQCLSTIPLRSYELLIFVSLDYSGRENSMFYQIRTPLSNCTQFDTQYP